MHAKTQSVKSILRGASYLKQKHRTRPTFSDFPNADMERTCRPGDRDCFRKRTLPAAVPSLVERRPATSVHGEEDATLDIQVSPFPVFSHAKAWRRGESGRDSERAGRVRCFAGSRVTR